MAARPCGAVPGSPAGAEPVPTTADLAHAAREALDLLHTVPDVLEAEVFVAANGQLLSRLSYSSHIPSNGVEEPKSTESHGIGLQVVFRSANGPSLGFGSEPSDLSPDGVRRALAKAREGAVHDPAFVSLPRQGAERRALGTYHDPRLLDLDDADLVDAGWRVVTGALRTFTASRRLAELAGTDDDLRRLRLLLG